LVVVLLSLLIAGDARRRKRTTQLANACSQACLNAAEGCPASAQHEALAGHFICERVERSSGHAHKGWTGTGSVCRNQCAAFKAVLSNPDVYAHLRQGGLTNFCNQIVYDTTLYQFIVKLTGEDPVTFDRYEDPVTTVTDPSTLPVEDKSKQLIADLFDTGNTGQVIKKAIATDVFIKAKLSDDQTIGTFILEPSDTCGFKGGEFDLAGLTDQQKCTDAMAAAKVYLDGIAQLDDGSGNLKYPNFKICPHGFTSLELNDQIGQKWATGRGNVIAGLLGLTGTPTVAVHFESRIMAGVMFSLTGAACDKPELWTITV
jgi:hypothetical protein